MSDFNVPGSRPETTLRTGNSAMEHRNMNNTMLVLTVSLDDAEYMTNMNNMLFSVHVVHTPGLHNKISANNIFARGWVAQKFICS